MNAFFYAEGEGPVPLEKLQNQKYHEIVSIRFYYDQTTSVIFSFHLSGRVSDLGIQLFPYRCASTGMNLWRNACARCNKACERRRR